MFKFLKNSIINAIIIFSFFLASIIFLRTIQIRRAENKQASELLERSGIIERNIEVIVGKKIPSISLKGINNTSSVDFLNGKYSVLLVLSSLSCKSCIDEAKYIERLNRALGEKINFFGVATIPSSYAIKEFIRKHSLSYTFLHDKYSEFKNSLGIKTTPIKLIVSPEGNIIEIDVSTFNIYSIQKKFKKRLIGYISGEVNK